MNESFIQTDELVKDLRAVVDSTFAIIFFGTPHRGSTQADFALAVARVVSAMSTKRYNPNIISSLKQNTEILTKLRADFESVLGHMINYNRFESTTFQENRGLSGLKGFQGKVRESCGPACTRYC